MYFVGKTQCFLCANEEVLKANEPSGWRAIKAENKIYYFCEDCLPENSASAAYWHDFYIKAFTKIHETDFNRPIRKILILRDEGPYAEVITTLYYKSSNNRNLIKC